MVIEQEIASQADLTAAFVGLGEAIREKHDAITFRITARKNSGLFQEGPNGNCGLSADGMLVAGALDQKVLPIGGRSGYSWKRTSVARNGDIIWVFWLTKKH